MQIDTADSLAAKLASVYARARMYLCTHAQDDMDTAVRTNFYNHFRVENWNYLV